VRKRRQFAPGEATQPAVTSSPASTANTPSIRSLQTAADQRAAEGSQTPLGTVAAGDRLPLPQGWSARGSQLQVNQTASRWNSYWHRVVVTSRHPIVFATSKNSKRRSRIWTCGGRVLLP